MAQKVAILGFGVEGKSAWSYYWQRGADVTVFYYKNPDAPKNAPIHNLPEGVKSIETDKMVEYGSELDRFDLVVRGADILPTRIHTKTPVTSITNEFFAHCPAPIIGVTGTKGKGTTSTLITLMLEATGYKAWLGGNIGKAPLDFLTQIQPTDYVVLELSSFQLMDLARGPHIAVGLMIAPEHLDWHKDFKEYLDAKGNIFSKQTRADTAVYFADNTDTTRIAQLSPGQKVPFFAAPGAWVDGETIKVGEESICKASEVGLLGTHNLQNVCAALTAAWQITQDKEALAKVIRDFKGLEHRLEFVGEIDGVKYYNDSFSTTPETAIAATQSFSEPKVLILGGSDKGSKYDELAKVVASNNVSGAVLIGDMAPIIKKSLAAAGFDKVVTGPTNMNEILAAAGKLAEPGGVVLLSPACASFGLFKDYKDRGQQFKSVVGHLMTKQ